LTKGSIARFKTHTYCNFLKLSIGAAHRDMGVLEGRGVPFISFEFVPELMTCVEGASKLLEIQVRLRFCHIFLSQKNRVF